MRHDPMREHHHDLLTELVGTDLWRAVKHEAALLQESLVSRLQAPSTTLIDLVAKEGHSSRLAAIREFIQGIEQIADRRAKQLREEREERGA